MRLISCTSTLIGIVALALIGCMAHEQVPQKEVVAQVSKEIKADVEALRRDTFNRPHEE